MDMKQDTSLRRSISPAWADHPANAFALLLAVFALHLLIRINLHGSLERDEAEIVYLTQQLQLGYGTQPPLYAWLQWLTFSVFGLNRFSLLVLKDLILVTLYVGMYRMARPMIGIHGAVAASASLLLFPQIGWESMRDLTHSVLLTSIACSTLWCYFAVLRKPSVGRYILFGALAGLGLQTKYNFAIFLGGLTCASLLVREHSAILWNRKAGIAAIVAVLVFLPHGVWLLQHIDQAATGTLNKMAEGTDGAGYLRNVATGLGSILLAAAAFAVVPVLVYTAVCWRLRRHAVPDFRSPDSRFFIGLYSSFLALLVCIVATGEVGKIKDRWMMPMLFSLPLAFLVMTPLLPRQVVFARMVRVAGAVAVLILVSLPVRTYLAPSLGKIAPPHHPYPALAAALERRFPGVTTVVTEGTLVAGNLRFERPALRTFLLDRVVEDGERLQGQLVLIMPGSAKPGWLDRFRSAYPGALVREQGRITLDYRFGGKGSMTFDYVLADLRSM